MYYIGIDLGGTNIAVGIVSETGELLKKTEIPTNPGRPEEEIAKDMALAAKDVTLKAGISLDDVAWIGIGSPGALDRKNGVILYANNLRFEEVPIREYVNKYWNIPVFVDNDANAAALGEAYSGSAVDCSDAVMITLGTGVGGGIIINHRIYSGFNGNGAEVGHSVIVYNGEMCTCGRRGCWEAYASVTGLIRQTKAAMAEHPESMMIKIAEEEGKVSGKTAFIAARKGDETGKAVVAQYIEYVAAGITDLINIFQPEVLCIGGAICKEGDFLLDPIKKVVERDTYTRHCQRTEIKIAKLGNDAGIIGAAMLGK